MLVRLRDFWRRRDRFQKLFLIGGSIFVVGYIGAVIGDNSRMSGSTSSRCEPVAIEVVSAIETGLTVGGGGSLTNAQAVRSDDFERVYFVAADLQGAGMNGSGPVGLWATNQIDAEGGLIFAVNSMAKEFSDWGHGDTSDARITDSDDGAEEAVDCAGG